MAKVFLWVRYGFCTCLGLALICLAAVSAPDPNPKEMSMLHPDENPGP